MSKPFLSALDVCKTGVNGYDVRLSREDERPVGFVIRIMDLRCSELPWSAHIYRQSDGKPCLIPGFHRLRREALAALLATVGGT